MDGEQHAARAARVGPAGAAAFLRDRFGGDASAPVPLGRGEWSASYAFDLPGAALVVRFSDGREDFEKDRRAVRYASAELPIPRIAEIGGAFDGFYAIAERASGRFIDEIDGREMRAVLPALFAALDAVRRADLAHTKGFGIWGADGDAPHASWREALLDVANDRPSSRTHGWRERLGAFADRLDRFRRLHGHLQELVDDLPEERQLVHSDLLQRNVLVSGSAISAVIDWGSSLYGDVLYDVAWLCFWAPWYPAWRGIDFAAEAERFWRSKGIELPRFRERLQCYQLHIALDSQAYSAFRGRFEAIDRVALRAAEIVRRS